MGRDEVDISKLKIYDTSMFPKLNREDVKKDHHLYLLNLTLEPYIGYITFTEEYLNNKAEEYEKKHLKSLNNENESWIVSDEYASKMHEIDNEFAQRYRESIIVQLFSFIEGSLVSSCKMYYSNKDIEDPSDNHFPEKGGLDDVKSFLKNNAGIELKLINKELDFFNNLRTLRNRIVHHKTSFFTDDKKKINQLNSLSKGRFQMRSKDDFMTMYFLYFDKPEFSFEIIENIKSLYMKLGKNRFYY